MKFMESTLHDILPADGRGLCQVVDVGKDFAHDTNLEGKRSG